MLLMYAQCMLIIGWHTETDVEKGRFCVPEYHEGIYVIRNNYTLVIIMIVIID